MCHCGSERLTAGNNFCNWVIEWAHKGRGIISLSILVKRNLGQSSSVVSNFEFGQSRKEWRRGNHFSSRRQKIRSCRSVIGRSWLFLLCLCFQAMHMCLFGENWSWRKNKIGFWIRVWVGRTVCTRWDLKMGWRIWFGLDRIELRAITIWSG